MLLGFFIRFRVHIVSAGSKWWAHLGLIYSTRMCLWESPRFIIICDVMWNEPSLFNGAICPRSAHAVLPSASCRGHQRMHHQRRKKWTRATRTTTMSKRWDYFHNYFPLRADPVSWISSTKHLSIDPYAWGMHFILLLLLLLLVLVAVLLAMLFSIASVGVAFIPPINVFHSSVLHPHLKIKQKIRKAFHNILPSIIFSQWKCVFHVF